MKNLIPRIQGNPKLLLGVTALFVILTVVTDQCLKSWATGLIFPVDRLGFQFFAYSNSGILGGYLADLDPWIIRIFFSVLFGFLVLGVSLVMHFLQWKKTPLLKCGLVVYVSGIFGNVYDRMTTGSVVDYAVIPGIEGMAFNFADLVVVIGFLLIGVSIFREADAIWYAKDKRNGYWVEPKFQKGFGIWISLVGFAHFLIIALYSFVFLKVYTSNEQSAALLGPDRLIRDYLIGLCVLETGALLVTFGLSVIFSHRLIGPLFAFEIFVGKQLGSEPTSAQLRLRQGDYFREILERIAGKLGRAQKPTE